MKTPTLLISQSHQRLGEWCPEKRQISLSYHLIQNYSWDTVINVLKHEMAHQMVTDVFKECHEKPHGRAFQKACEALHCFGPFRSAYGDLPQGEVLWGSEDLPEDYLRVLEKVDKLLSLANSGNENEALLAMNKALELQQKYNIQQLSFLSEEDYCYKIIELKKKRTSLQESLIASILQDFFWVNIVHSRTFDVARACELNTIELIGTRANVHHGEYIYFFLKHKIDQLWTSYQASHQISGREKRSYQYGLLRGFRKKLSKPASKELKALVLASDKFLNLYTKKRFPRLHNSGRGRGQISENSFQQGVSDGGKIVISKGLETKSSQKGKLLIGKINSP